MEYDKLISSIRLGCEQSGTQEDRNARSEFKRDFDRIVFSPSFRRLQGKTQVFPFPSDDHIHNRLTHSLEVYSIARSLGTISANTVSSEQFPPEIVGDFVGAAALAHDIGNTPFGHSGEEAFARYFNSEPGKQFIASFSKQEKCDLQRFEGNAIGFRMLTYSKPMVRKNKGGLGLTYSTLASFLKYPTRSSLCNDKNGVSEKKHSFCKPEEELVKNIFTELGIKQKTGGKWPRYPFAFLVEAADDIAYRIIDFEDGYRLGLIDYDEIESLFKKIIDAHDNIAIKGLDNICNKRDKISYLRAKAINSLIYQCAEQFQKNWTAINDYKYEQDLFSSISSHGVIKELDEISISRLYNAKSVAEIEIAGFEIIQGLLGVFVTALLCEHDTTIGKKVRQLLPKEFYYTADEISFSGYELVLNISEFICGMTDSFAVDLFRKLKGIDIPSY
jgi:dGTPase